MEHVAQTKQQTHQTSSAFTHKGGLLQRKCACGGVAGIDSMCEECRGQKLSLQQRSLNLTESPQLSSPRQHALSSFSQVQIRSATPGPIQVKLAISQPGDRDEQEADQVAEQVMRMTNADPTLSDDEDKVKNSLMRKQSKELGANAADGFLDVPPVVHAVLISGRGQPLDTMTRVFMEPRFEYDFSKVRVHTDKQAAESARTINALAYTVGRDVVFGKGQYAPATSGGRRLLAHELTHVVQQLGRASIEESPRRQNAKGRRREGSECPIDANRVPRIGRETRQVPKGPTLA